MPALQVPVGLERSSSGDWPVAAATAPTFAVTSAAVCFSQAPAGMVSDTFIVSLALAPLAPLAPLPLAPLASLALVPVVGGSVVCASA